MKKLLIVMSFFFSTSIFAEQMVCPPVSAFSHPESGVLKPWVLENNYTAQGWYVVENYQADLRPEKVLNEAAFQGAAIDGNYSINCLYTIAKIQEGNGSYSIVFWVELDRTMQDKQSNPNFKPWDFYQEPFHIQGSQCLPDPIPGTSVVPVEYCMFETTGQLPSSSN